MNTCPKRLIEVALPIKEIISTPGGRSPSGMGIFPRYTSGGRCARWQPAGRLSALLYGLIQATHRFVMVPNVDTPVLTAHAEMKTRLCHRWLHITGFVRFCASGKAHL